MRYFAKFTSGSQPKNKAQEHAVKFGLRFKSTLIGSDAALDKFVQKLQLGLDLINHQHHRCTNIDYRYNKHHDLNTFEFYVGDNLFNFSFYPIQDEFDVIQSAEKTISDVANNSFNL